MDKQQEAAVSGAFVGAILIITTVFIIWKGAENSCESMHDVYDCELKAQPFQPVES